MPETSAENLKVLIISYTFPPQGGVGGRRWAKFAKYFHQSEVPVKVLASEPLNGHSIWKADVQGFETSVRYVSSPVGAILRRTPSTLIDKIAYRLVIAYLKWIQRGNYYDWSVRWNKYLLPAVEDAIARGFTTIIASGGPFSYLYDLSNLKVKYESSIKLIADFRDPWTNNKTAFGYDQISASRLAFEKEKERAVAQRFDAVVSVAEDMTAHFRALAGEHRTLCQTIINGFDPDEFLLKDRGGQTGVIRFVFVGTLYDKTLRHVERLVAVLEQVEPKERTRYQFEFCGNMSREAKTLLKKIPEVKIHGSLPREQAHELLRSASVAMLFLTDDLTYSLSTKFCEYIAMELPIWIISNEGSTPELIQSNHLGIHSYPSRESLLDGLRYWMDSDWRNTLNGYSEFDKEPYNVKKLTDDYLQLLTKINRP